MVETIASTFKALSDKNRIRIVNMLRRKPMCVCEITAILKLSQSTVSGHLKVLKAAGLVEDSRDGLWVEYNLRGDSSFHSSILQLLIPHFDQDSQMEQESKQALNVDREVICRK